MNGLEAIKLMEQGNIVKADCIGGTFLFKIDRIYSKKYLLLKEYLFFI